MKASRLSVLAAAAVLATGPSVVRAGSATFALDTTAFDVVSGRWNWAVFALDTTAFDDNSGTRHWALFPLDTTAFARTSGALPWFSFRLDTLPGPRAAGAVESLVYDAAWSGGGAVRLLRNGTCLLETGSGAAGVFDWGTTNLPSGEYTLEHVSDGVVLTAVFLVDNPATATRTTPVPVPYSWLDGWGLAGGGDYEAAAWEPAANGANAVWECYVAGLDPTNGTSRLLAIISMTDGAPCVTWAPDLNEGGTKHERVYTVEGKAALTNDWDAVDADSRFFRVKVSMP